MTKKMDAHDCKVAALAMERKYAANTIRAWFTDAAKTLRDRADEMDRYKLRFDECLGGKEIGFPSTTPEDIVSWAVGSVANIQTSLRLDMAVTYAVRLARATPAKG